MQNCVDCWVGKMGGLTSKTFKPRKKDNKETEEDKRTSVTGVEHRDKEFKLSRETKSAYYYGHKTGATEGVDKSDTATAQKRVILQNAGSSDHKLFKRVSETPTAIYYEPNDEDDTNAVAEKGEEKEKKNIVLEKKNIVLENAPVVEKRIKVIRDGSSDITIRPESITIQKHDMIIDPTVGKKPRGNMLNTYSVMVKNKETDAVPTATVTLDDVKGLTAIEEGKERDSKILEETETDDTTLQNGQKEESSDKKEQLEQIADTENQGKQPTVEDDRNEHQPSKEDKIDIVPVIVHKDNDVRPKQPTEKESVENTIDDKDKSDSSEQNTKKDEVVDSISQKRDTNEDKPKDLNLEKTVNDISGIDESQIHDDKVDEHDRCSNSENITEQRHTDVDSNKMLSVSKEETLSASTISANREPNTNSYHVQPSAQSNEHVVDHELKENNIITDKDTGITIIQDSDLDKQL